jgi:hypothetical protein
MYNEFRFSRILEDIDWEAGGAGLGVGDAAG